MLEKSLKPIKVRLIVAVAVLATLVLFVQAASAQEAEMTVEYAEDRTDAVLTLTARDPEGVTPIVWSLLTVEDGTQDLGIVTVPEDPDDVKAADVVDHDDFKISQDGVLTFDGQPSFEDPKGGTENSNTYKVVVQASDGGATDKLSWFKVTVTVTNVEEPGKVTWTVDHDGGDHTETAPGLTQFQAGASLMASVTDDDVTGADKEPDNIRWQWYRSSSQMAMGTEIDGATSDTYTARDEATDNDVGMYLRAVATYSDDRGPNKTAYLVSDNPVQAAREDNTAPKFPSDTATRQMMENHTDAIGAPITATDADGDVPHYSKADGGADNASFTIDKLTGELKGALDFDNPTDTDSNNTYVVTIMATDSSGENSEIVTVTITVTDVNEAPTFTAETPAPGMAADHAEANDALTVGTYTATDPEEGSVSLSLSGDDSDMFELTDPDPENPVSGSKVLSFKAKPDFEMPGDSNNDNIYEVTVEASDDMNTATRSVTVKVTDSDEGGKVELSSQDALIGVELTATLTDSDGGVPDPRELTGVTWQWAISEDGSDESFSDISGATSDTYTPTAGDRGDYLQATAMYTDRTRDVADDETNMLFMNTATSAVTTAVRNNPENQAPTFKEGASTFRVVEENTKALTAETGDDADDDDAETDNLADNVGKPVTATDADGDMPTYTLGGSNADMFRVRANGQIEVGDKAMLDYEKKRRYTVTVIADDSYGESNSTASITVTIHVTDLDEGPTIMDKADSKAKGEQSVDEYAENRTDAVLTLTARDPEGVTPIVWSKLEEDDGEVQDLGIFTDSDGDGEDDSADDVGLDDIADRALFDISQEGVLTFKAPPNFESPADANTDNTYKVVVQASDGGKTDKLSWFKVTVTVTDVPEPGKVTWTVDHDGTGGHDPTEPGLTQFRVGASLAASVTDGDGTVGSVRWEWYRSSSKTSMGTKIEGADSTGLSSTYITTDSGDPPDEGGDDSGKYIHVKATYKVDNGPDEMASLASDRPVQAEIVDNTAPEFAYDTVARRVMENSTDAIGAPITATDADGDVRHYWIDGDGADNDSFTIDKLTGELKGALDFDVPTDNTYVVTIMATDSSGANSDIVTVTITVTDVNEKPTFTAGTSGMADDHAEASDDLTVDDAYTATDPEGGTVELSLSGDDAGMFELGTDSDTGAGATQVLSFKAKPDFEMPGDKNKDNIYEVTVEASDDVNTATRSVTVKVTDSDEDGKVKLSSQDALIGVELTATLTDSDGGVPDPRELTGVTWQWATSEDGSDESFSDISGATSDTYTPTAGDRGDYLQATAMYTDRTRDAATVDPNMLFMNTATSAATTAVRINPDNQAPKFKEGASTFRVVEENTKALAGADGDDADDDALPDADDNLADNVGKPVTATDDADPVPTYTLGGSDKDMFRIRANGQIEVGAKAMLDYETKSSYTVTVTATDSSGDEDNNSASITVTIYVTDLDEGPMISTGGLAVSGLSRADYAEDRTDAVATYTASGTDAAQATWSLSGDDAGDFDISSSGELTFASKPDFEAPADADEDNVYEVTVEADDGTNTDSRAVTVTVTDVEDAEPDLLTSYDANDNDKIDKAEVYTAIDDLIDHGLITKADVYALIDLFIEGSE